MKSIKSARAQFQRILVLLALFSFVVNALMLTMPIYMLQIYDRILPSQSMDTLLFLSIIAVSALVVLGILEAVRAVIASRAATRIETVLGADVLRVSMMVSRSSGATTMPIRDLAAVKNFIASRTIFSLLDLPFAPLFIGILYIIHPKLFWLTVAGAVILLCIALLNQWVINRPFQRSHQEQSKAMASAQSMSQNAHAMRAMGMTQNAVELWGDHEALALTAQGNVDTRNAVLSGLSRTVRLGLQVAILGFGALLVLQGELTPGMIFASSIISGRGLQPIDQIIGGWRQIAAAKSSWKNLSETMESVGEETEKTAMMAPKGAIAVEGVSVLGGGGIASPPILNRVSFEVKPGDVLGVVGPSGSGKSTLARILVGAQVPKPGTVRIDNTDIQNWEPSQLGQHIGYLGQEMDLLPGTIAQNIARLDKEPDSAAVLEAAQKAQVHELIQGLPQGYDTFVGPGGMGLSGGQRQRVGLARAFFGNPQIMVLDEPNANLDDDGEVALQKAIFEARKSGVTIIIVTQRKQILNIVGKILRLHQGNVDFFGTQKEFIRVLQAHREKKQGGPPPAQPAAPKNTAAPTTGKSKPKANPYGQNVLKLEGNNTDPSKNPDKKS